MFAAATPSAGDGEILFNTTPVTVSSFPNTVTNCTTPRAFSPKPLDYEREYFSRVDPVSKSHVLNWGGYLHHPANGILAILFRKMLFSHDGLSPLPRLMRSIVTVEFRADDKYELNQQSPGAIPLVLDNNKLSTSSLTVTKPSPRTSYNL